MGIVEQVLSDFSLSTGESIKIEYNEGGKIHMHIDNIRVDFSQEEFIELADVNKQALKELREMKNTNND